MSAVTALVTFHAGVEATASLPTGARSRKRYPDAAAANLGAVGAPDRFFGVVFVSVDNESEAGYGTRHPDLAEGPVAAERLLQVSLRGVRVEIGHVQAVSFFLRIVAATAAAASAAAAPIPTSTR